MGVWEIGNLSTIFIDLQTKRSHVMSRLGKETMEYHSEILDLGLDRILGKM